jgi:hypothetical protein
MAGLGYRSFGARRAEARAIMGKLGYGPKKRLALKVSTRNIPPYRDPAVIRHSRQCDRRSLWRNDVLYLVDNGSDGDMMPTKALSRCRPMPATAGAR